MEEDIDILEDFIQDDELYELYRTSYIDSIRKALENLIKGYRELEEKKDKIYKNYQKLEKDYCDLHEYMSKTYDLGYSQGGYDWCKAWVEKIETDYIPKSKIKDKIEEYKQEMKEIRAKEKGLIWNHRLHKLDYAIEVLQELMEDK